MRDDDDGQQAHAHELQLEEQQRMSANFLTLSKIDVSRHLEKKGNFSYLSWAYAVHELRTAAPEATWRVVRFDGLPFLATAIGYFVETEVTVDGITLSQIHPVLDARNKPISAPTPFDINTSIQRCLTKNIALHGLGLSVYAGEDLPMATSDADVPEAIADDAAERLAVLRDAALLGTAALKEAWEGTTVPVRKALVGELDSLKVAAQAAMASA